MNIRVIRNSCGEPYLIRLTFFELFRRKNDPAGRSGGFSLKLHIILRSDEDREIHDHPWTFITWMLAGGYYEATPESWVGKTPILRRLWVKPGSLRLCHAPYPHKLELRGGNPAVTLVFMFPRFREWGFYTRNGWVPWFKFKSDREC